MRGRNLRLKANWRTTRGCWSVCRGRAETVPGGNNSNSGKGEHSRDARLEHKKADKSWLQVHLERRGRTLPRYKEDLRMARCKTNSKLVCCKVDLSCLCTKDSRQDMSNMAHSTQEAYSKMGWVHAHYMTKDPREAVYYAKD